LKLLIKVVQELVGVAGLVLGPGGSWLLAILLVIVVIVEVIVASPILVIEIVLILCHLAEVVVLILIIAFAILVVRVLVVVICIVAVVVVVIILIVCHVLIIVLDLKAIIVLVRIIDELCFVLLILVAFAEVGQEVLVVLVGSCTRYGILVFVRGLRNDLLVVGCELADRLPVVVSHLTDNFPRFLDGLFIVFRKVQGRFCQDIILFIV
jgi:hypothetical protein